MRRLASIRAWWVLAVCAVVMAAGATAVGSGEAGTGNPAAESTGEPSIPGGPALGEGPRIEFDDLTFDFGAMYQNEEVSHTFTFRNTGDALLNIEKVKSSCGCTAAMPEKRKLAPGEEATIKVTFKSGTRRDRVTQHVSVDSNDADQPRVTLTIKGVVKVEVDVVPRGFYIGKMKPGETVERSIELLPVTVKSFKILGVTATHPALHPGEPVPLKDEKNKERGGYRLDVRFGPAEEPGRISARVIIQTDLEHSRKLRISVYGTVVEEEPSSAEEAA